jgi:FKBP-type peptidyl-prolyl cis-trans isomerase
MKSRLISVLSLGLLVSSVSAQDKPDLTNRKQSTSYALGMDIVSTLQRQGVDVDTQALAAGIADMLAGKPALTPDQQKIAMDDMAKAMAAKAEAARRVAAVKNLKDGQEFLAANARKEGVKVMDVTAPNGTKAALQYLILQSGAGPSPRVEDIVNVHYVGSLIDGTVFDSSLKHNQPLTIGMDKVIPGWSAALRQMKAGDKWRLFIPPALGYGPSGLLKIPPNSTIIFDLELLSFHSAHGTNSAPVTNAPPKP